MPEEFTFALVPLTSFLSCKNSEFEYNTNAIELGPTNTSRTLFQTGAGTTSCRVISATLGRCAPLFVRDLRCSRSQLQFEAQQGRSWGRVWVESNTSKCRSGVKTDNKNRSSKHWGGQVLGMKIHNNIDGSADAVDCEAANDDVDDEEEEDIVDESGAYARVRRVGSRRRRRPTDAPYVLRNAFGSSSSPAEEVLGRFSNSASASASASASVVPVSTTVIRVRSTPVTVSDGDVVCVLPLLSASLPALLRAKGSPADGTANPDVDGVLAPYLKSPYTYIFRVREATASSARHSTAVYLREQKRLGAGLLSKARTKKRGPFVETNILSLDSGGSDEDDAVDACDEAGRDCCVSSLDTSLTAAHGSLSSTGGRGLEAAIAQTRAARVTDLTELDGILNAVRAERSAFDSKQHERQPDNASEEDDKGTSTAGRVTGATAVGADTANAAASKAATCTAAGANIQQPSDAGKTASKNANQRIPRAREHPERRQRMLLSRSQIGEWISESDVVHGPRMTRRQRPASSRVATSSVVAGELPAWDELDVRRPIKRSRSGLTKRLEAGREVRRQNLCETSEGIFQALLEEQECFDSISDDVEVVLQAHADAQRSQQPNINRHKRRRNQGRGGDQHIRDATVRDAEMSVPANVKSQHSTDSDEILAEVLGRHTTSASSSRSSARTSRQVFSFAQLTNIGRKGGR